MPRNLYLSAAAVLATSLTAAAPAAAQTVRTFTPAEVVGTWLRFSDPLDGVNSNNWSAGAGFVNYSTNNGGTLASDFLVTGDFSFSVRINSTGTDNDRYGVVFGFADPQNHYRFSWEGGGFTEEAGLSGMSLIREQGGAVSSLFTRDPDTNWAAGAQYDVTVSRTGSQVGLNVRRVSDGFVFADVSVTDTAFTAGRVGLWNSSQTTQYRNITLTTPSVVPEPGTLALVPLGALALAGAVRRRSRAS